MKRGLPPPAPLGLALDLHHLDDLLLEGGYAAAELGDNAVAVLAGIEGG